MLASHRDQENLAHGQHHAQSKQQPKTPGARYPKTPLKIPLNDENAPTVFGGKSAIGASARMGGNDKLMMTKGTGAKQSLVTPMTTRNRAPLGNKTTNAKARTGQPTTVKDMVKRIEKSQSKPTTVQRPKQRSAEVAPIKFQVKQDEAVNWDNDEPEYAPPPVAPLPYESDVLPPGGLTCEGLKQENLFKGYYEFFYNPIDDEGVSRQEREFEAEMRAATERAIERNEREMAKLRWDSTEPVKSSDPVLKKSSGSSKNSTFVRGNNTTRTVPRYASTIASRKAASALSGPSGNRKTAVPKATAPVRKPLTSLTSNGKTTAKSTSTKSSQDMSFAGEVASRNTIGYNKGRAAATMVQPRKNTTTSALSGAVKRPAKPSESTEDYDCLTMTPARARQATAPAKVSPSRPRFMSIFEEEGDDEDLPPIRGPLSMSDDEDEEFELKLDF